MTVKHLPGLIMICALLTACSSDDNDKKKIQPQNQAAIINTVASDYSDSDLEIVDIENKLFSGELEATAAGLGNGLSDYSVTARGQYFYRIGRYGIDTITKYSIENPTTAIYTYSTKDDASDPTSNPYKLVFASDTKAYLIRYNSSKVWIVNPSAATEVEFKTGEIDLSAYDDGDGSPEASDGVIVDSKLFITMQRQASWTVIDGNAWVAVIDTTTDSEITVDSSAALKGIQLQTNNPENIIYHPAAGLFVQSIGSYGSWPAYIPEYIGGIERINTTDYSTDILVDDGDATTHPYGLISSLVIVSSNKGYFTGYNAWGDSGLHEFNPATGTVQAGFVASLDHDDIRSIDAGPSSSLWVGIADNSNPHVLVIDTTDNTVMDEISITMNPAQVVFAEVP